MPPAPPEPSPPAAATADLRDSLIQRRTMVDCQIRTFDVTDQRLIARLLAVPRERFMPDALRSLSYSDVGLTSGEGGRYFLPPMVLARLIQGCRVRAGDRVLDVGAGAGYSTALLAGLAAEVVALEDDTARCRDVAARLAGFGLGRLQVMERALGRGVPEAAPFDAILVNGAAEVGLDPLLAQLGEGGRLAVIQRSPADPTGRAAKALCFEKRNGAVGTRYLFDASAPILPAFRRPPAFAF